LRATVPVGKNEEVKSYIKMWLKLRKNKKNSKRNINQTFLAILFSLNN
jgi:hypothetical protein